MRNAERTSPIPATPESPGADGLVSTGGCTRACESASALREPVLYFDGECGLCSRSVRWCLRHERRPMLRFAPLQGATYAAVDLPGKPAGVETLVLVDAAGLHMKSEAVLRMLRYVGGPWTAAERIGRLIPRFVRDAVYQFVAARRYRWFGRAAVCAAPGGAASARFLP
ncbi:MAG: DUF393 domain-containing protein [Phycisphaerae bacterium]|nr:DUF393 domain-containing protein [Planctomycetia bacterium]MCK6464114.1 DCC1-like thiol-disulfide oxidoreductase family protein [Phycisphaerae bacterium]MCL4717712.1 DUF393 domain-containing protein [Phycisphaerae bacterium]NUQ09401.1 DUF393 domain-containing protein [Phycisphaerae bacterium]